MNKYLLSLLLLSLNNIGAFNKEHWYKFYNEQLKVEKKQLSANGLDLSGIDFSELTHVIKEDAFLNIDLRNANISGCDFGEYDLSGAIYNHKTVFGDSKIKTSKEKMITEVEYLKSKIESDRSQLLADYHARTKSTESKEESKS